MQLEALLLQKTKAQKRNTYTNIRSSVKFMIIIIHISFIIPCQFNLIRKHLSLITHRRDIELLIIDKTTIEINRFHIHIFAGFNTCPEGSVMSAEMELISC